MEVRSPILFSMMHTLGENLDRYLTSDVFAKEMPKEETKTKDSISDEEWKEKLQVLNKRLDDFDGEGIAQSIQELKQFALSEDKQKLLRICEKAVNDFAYDVAMDIVSSAL